MVLVLGFSKPPEAAPQAPEVQAKQEAKSTLEHQKNAHAIVKTAPESTSSQSGVPEGNKAEQHAAESGEQGSEFWPAIWGIRIKITDSLIALFTFVLAIVTGALWIETLRLRRGADKQAKHFEKSVKATEKAAIASEKTADAALLQAHVAEKALIKLERPIIYPSEIGFFGTDDSREIRVKLKNFGRSPAILNSVDLIVSISPTGNIRTKQFHREKSFMVESIIGSKESTDYIVYSDPAIVQYWQSIEFSISSLAISVAVSYGDILGDTQKFDGRWFVWSQKRTRFFPGLQAWGS